MWQSIFIKLHLPFQSQLTELPIDDGLFDNGRSLIHKEKWMLNWG